MKKKRNTVFVLLLMALLFLCLGTAQSWAEKKRFPPGHLSSAVDFRQQTDPNFMKEQVKNMNETGTLEAISRDSAQGGGKQPGRP